MFKKMLAAAVAALFLALPSARATQQLLITTPSANTGIEAAYQGSFIATGTAIQPTGTGVIDSFLRIRQTGSEAGFNTSTSPLPLDDQSNSGNNYTHAIQLGAVPIVTINGVQYREFLLDVNNQPGADGLISLNQVQIFKSSGDVGNASYTLQTAGTNQEAVISFSNATQVFQLNDRTPTSDAWELVVNSGNGSGSGDMFFYVANSAFTGSSNSTYITLFSQFGHPPGQYYSTAGFEEWAVQQPGEPQAVPVPPGIALVVSGLGALGVRSLRRLRRSQPVTA